MNAPELIALATLSDGATHPSREIDVAIFWHVNREAWLKFYWATMERDYVELAEMPTVGIGYQAMVQRGAPGFTSSLDAAVSLVPWDWLEEWGYRFAIEQEALGWAARADQRCDNGDTILGEVCATKALATVSFALRACAQLQSEVVK